MKVRKKPVIVEAWQVDIKELDRYEAPNWVMYEHTSKAGHLYNHMWKYLVISTLEGDMRADIGDYIIKGVEGELYPVRKDIFEKTYEVVEQWQ